MTPLCSILVPSRKRFDRLKKTLTSLRASADKPDEFEFLVRFDEDDAEATNRFMEMAYHPLIHFVWGKRPESWNTGIKLLWNELADHAKGDWLWAMSDDMEIQKAGDAVGWDTQLSAIPEQCYVHPQTHNLGGSIYDRDMGGPIPIIRKSFWESAGQFYLIDYTICQTAIQHGLVLRWLNGITIKHSRDYENTLVEHRKH